MIVEWISVEDRLPEIPKDHFAVGVLVVSYDSTEQDGYKATVCEGNWNGTQWNCLKFSEEEKHPSWDWNWLNVTHWMPLPEPPTHIRR